jgi:hypothetical protein
MDLFVEEINTIALLGWTKWDLHTKQVQKEFQQPQEQELQLS